MKTKTPTVRNLIDEEVFTGINSVIEGRAKKFELKPFRPTTIAVIPAVVKDYLTAKGWECGELETNGWDSDWWLTFTKGEKSFTAHGSGYYGGFHFAATEA